MKRSYAIISTLVVFALLQYGLGNWLTSLLIAVVTYLALSLFIIKK